MKKAIGLTANTSDFRPNLPQTKHLNYFMGTNPVYMAKGGDVKAGIPNYPDVNVTRGFLPAALGFDDGGEADSYWSRLYKAAVKVVAGYLGKDEDDEKVQETAKKFIGTEEGKKIAEQIIQSEQGASSGAPQDTGTPIPVIPSDRQPQFNIPQPLTPKETVTENTIPGGYYGAPPATSQTTPGIGPRLETSPGESSGAPQDTGGITEIKPESKNPLDLNGDGEVNMKDLEYAQNNPVLSWAIPLLKKALGIADEKLEEWADKDDEKEVVPDLPEKIIPEGPNVDKERETKESEEQEDKTKIKPKIKPQPDGGGITTLPEVSKEQEDRDKEDEWTGIGPNEQKLYKLLAAERAKNTGQPDSGGITDKKDVPAWALPMMSAGFAMMASKSPNFMQALGEGGQKGLETYAAQKTAEEEKLDKESERELRKSQSKYYETRTQKPDIKVMTDDQGRGVYYRWDNEKQDYVSLNRIAVPSNAEIAKELEEGHSAQIWATYSVEKKQQLIQERRNQYLGIVQSNLSTVEEKGGGWSLPDLWELLNKGDKWLEEQSNKKDGGIVSLRR